MIQIYTGVDGTHCCACHIHHSLYVGMHQTLQLVIHVAMLACFTCNILRSSLTQANIKHTMACR